MDVSSAYSGYGYQKPVSQYKPRENQISTYISYLKQENAEPEEEEVQDSDEPVCNLPGWELKDGRCVLKVEKSTGAPSSPGYSYFNTIDGEGTCKFLMFVIFAILGVALVLAIIRASKTPSNHEQYHVRRKV